MKGQVWVEALLVVAAVVAGAMIALYLSYGVIEGSIEAYASGIKVSENYMRAVAEKLYPLKIREVYYNGTSVVVEGQDGYLIKP